MTLDTVHVTGVDAVVSSSFGSTPASSTKVTRGQTRSFLANWYGAAIGQAVRYLPKGTEMEMDFAIVDDMLGITSFDPLFIVVIYSAKIARSAAQLFEFAWREGKR